MRRAAKQAVRDSADATGVLAQATAQVFAGAGPFDDLTLRDRRRAVTMLLRLGTWFTCEVAAKRSELINGAWVEFTDSECESIFAGLHYGGQNGETPPRNMRLGVVR